jgi:hypothetical protein
MTPQPTTTPTTTNINTAWNVLHAAIAQRRPIRARYHNHLRVLCPHAIGWKNGRPKALVYQTAIIDPPTAHDHRGWRSLYVDQIEDATISHDHWQTANNYTPHTTGIDTLAATIT